MLDETKAKRINLIAWWNDEQSADMIALNAGLLEGYKWTQISWKNNYSFLDWCKWRQLNDGGRI